jgi:hypothetical protein
MRTKQPTDTSLEQLGEELPRAIAASEEGISKTAFASAVGVTPGRVTQWITSGQIDGEALVGSGRSAKIRPQVAIQQLRETLDVDRRACASAKARLDGIATAQARPVISEAFLQRLAAKLSDALVQVLRREFADTAADVAVHGADSGVDGRERS